MVICLQRGADLHMAQLMPLPLTVFCSSKIQIGFTFLLPAYPGCPGKEAVKWLLLLLLLGYFFIYFRLQTSSVLIGYLSEQMCLRPLQMCQYQIFQRNESFTLCYAILPSVMSLICNSKFRLRIAAFVGRQCGTVCQQHCETVTCN